MVNKAKLQYSTYMKVAGCGQVDYGISDDFESEGNAGLVNFQQSVCCEVHLGLQKKKDEFVGLYYYCFCINRQGSRCLSEICVNRPETLRILRQ